MAYIDATHQKFRRGLPLRLLKRLTLSNIASIEALESSSPFTLVYFLLILFYHHLLCLVRPVLHILLRQLIFMFGNCQNLHALRALPECPRRQLHKCGHNSSRRCVIAFQFASTVTRERASVATANRFSSQARLADARGRMIAPWICRGAVMSSALSK